MLSVLLGVRVYSDICASLSLFVVCVSFAVTLSVPMGVCVCSVSWSDGGGNTSACSRVCVRGACAWFVCVGECIFLRICVSVWVGVCTGVFTCVPLMCVREREYVCMRAGRVAKKVAHSGCAVCMRACITACTMCRSTSAI